MFRVGEKVKLKGCGNKIYTIGSFNKKKEVLGHRQGTTEFCKKGNEACDTWAYTKDLIKIYQPGQQLEFEWMLS